MSTLWIDQKYASLLGTQLQQFKVKKTKPYIAQFRCPLCGDSATNRFKTRGHFYEHKGHINFKCFNCGASTTLNNFMKSQNTTLHTEYRLEILKETGGANTNIDNFFAPDIEKFSSRRIDSFDPFKELTKISQLKPNHPAKIYVQERKIPPNTHYRIYYSPTYYYWVNSILPGKFSEKAVALDEPRIVFPFIDSKGYVFGFTGRSLSKSTNMRYSTIILDETKEKVFGQENIDKTKNVYVVEGPIDSLFLDNCIAMAGADINLNNIADRDKIVCTNLSMKYEKGGVAEDKENAQMVLNNNKQIAHHTKELPNAIKGKKVPAWVVAKVNRSASDLSDATHYMDGQGESYAKGGSVELKWTNLSIGQRYEFLDSLGKMNEITPSSKEEYTKRAFRFLPKKIKEKFLQSKYADKYGLGGFLFGAAVGAGATYYILKNKKQYSKEFEF